MRFLAITLSVILPLAILCRAQQDTSAAAITMLPHPDDIRWWISGQANIIFQAHPAFRALYSVPQSLNSSAEHATSEVFTLYTGVEVTPTTELLFDIESTGGHGISDALGLAGFTNLDVVRNPTWDARHTFRGASFIRSSH